MIAYHVTTATMVVLMLSMIVALKLEGGERAPVSSSLARRVHWYFAKKLRFC